MISPGQATERGETAGKIALTVRRLTGMTGASTIVLEHARFLVSLGFAVDIFSETATPALVASVGATSRRVRGFGLTDLQKRRSFAARVEEAVRAGGYMLSIGNGDLLHQDVVFLHNLIRRAHELIPGGSDRKVRTVGRVHDALLSGASFRLLVANSRMMKEDLVARYGIPPVRIAVVHPGSDLSRFSAADKPGLRARARGELGVREGELLVGLVTSGDFAKRGVKPFLEAVNALPGDLMARTRVLVVGKEKNFASYGAALTIEAMRSRVTHIPQEKRIERLFAALDLSVLPAYLEEFGLVVREAMAMGLPVLTTRNVGASEILPDVQKPYVLPSNEPGMLAEKMSELLRDAALRETLGRENVRASAGSDWRTYNEAVCGQYAALGLLPPRPGCSP